MPPPSDSAEASRVLVITPTFNEIESMQATIAAVRAATPDVDILVVDDASPDGTGALADRIAADDPHVHVLDRVAEQGPCAAYLTPAPLTISPTNPSTSCRHRTTPRPTHPSVG
jgi:dolichol-phosphate mannosyltransferase